MSEVPVTCSSMLLVTETLCLFLVWLNVSWWPLQCFSHFTSHLLSEHLLFACVPGVFTIIVRHLYAEVESNSWHVFNGAMLFYFNFFKKTVIQPVAESKTLFLILKSADVSLTLKCGDFQDGFTLTMRVIKLQNHSNLSTFVQWKVDVFLLA